MKLLTKVQVVVILACVAVGIFAFASPYFLGKSGVIVVSITNPECQNIHAGDTITEVEGKQIKGIQDFVSLRFQPKLFVSMVVN